MISRKQRPIDRDLLVFRDAVESDGAWSKLLGIIDVMLIDSSIAVTELRNDLISCSAQYPWHSPRPVSEMQDALAISIASGRPPIVVLSEEEPIGWAHFADSSYYTFSGAAISRKSAAESQLLVI